MDICIKNIKAVHEDIKDGRDKDFARAFDLMQEAECIYYLGFGYGPVNMDRLKIRDLLADKATFGTRKGLSQHECNEARNLVGGTSQLNPVLGADCIQLLREYVDWT